jgi:molybdopterin synthase catalytic subunit
VAVRIQTAPFDPGAETNRFIARDAEAGAAVTFTGLVRSGAGDPLEALVLDAYPELAVHEIGRLVEMATERFGLLGAEVIHRYGRMLPGEPIVLVMTRAPHRQAAFEAAEFLMDYLKTDAPFWKKEEAASGARWVAPRAADDAARERWRSDD